MTEKYTFCRICEPCCPMIASVDETGQVANLKADAGHPSGAIPCHKGQLYLDIHQDPDRVNWPIRRENSRDEAQGVFNELSWDEALNEISEKLQSIRQRYGDDAIGFYFGNPAAFHSSGFFMAGRFQDALNTRMRFSAATQDASNKLVGAAKIYGATNAFPVVDIDNTDYLLCIGSNPKVSRWTVCSFPNSGGKELKAIKQRGGKVTFVNPRVIESSTDKTGETVQIKPGTDVYFLAALMLEIKKLGGYDEAFIAEYGRNVDQLNDFIERYPAHRVASVTGIAASTVADIARELLEAKSAAVYMSTGVNQSRQGLLCYLLVEMINFFTGNLGRKGGSYKPNNAFNAYPPATQETQVVETTVGSFTIAKPMADAVLPSAIIPDLMSNGDIKALIVLGGNPLLSVGGESKFRQGAKNMELMISMDIYRSATGELCDYVLPAVDWLERADINHFGASGQPRPYIQFSDRVVEPAAGRRSEWWIMSAILQKMGLPSDLDNSDCQSDGLDMLAGMLAANGVDVACLRSAPHQSQVLPDDDHDGFFRRCLQHSDQKIDCFPTSFITTGLIERCETIFSELSVEDEGQLKLVPLRTPYMHNSWLSNLPRFSKARFAGNPVYVSSKDALAHSLSNGDQVLIRSSWGEVDTRVIIDDDLPLGTIAMSHGGGHQESFGMQHAQKNPGRNYNALVPDDADSVEPLSFMAWLSAIPVSIEKVTTEKVNAN